jgi:ADP-ribose pyrophosphatase
MKIIKWKTVATTEVLKAYIFKYFKIKRESPTNGKVGEFDVIQCLNWVNVIAITPDDKIVLIKQYRQGTDQVTIEIPGGAVHHGEDPKLAAIRELREESGYTSENWIHIGKVDANPAFMTNCCDTYLAIDAIKTHELELDPFEEIEVELHPTSEIPNMVTSKAISHSIVVCAFYLWQVHSSRHP